MRGVRWQRWQRWQRCQSLGEPVVAAWPRLILYRRPIRRHQRTRAPLQDLPGNQKPHGLPLFGRFQRCIAQEVHQIA